MDEKGVFLGIEEYSGFFILIYVLGVILEKCEGFELWVSGCYEFELKLFASSFGLFIDL